MADPPRFVVAMPTPLPPPTPPSDAARASARRTALVVGLVALGIYLAAIASMAFHR